MRAVVQRVSNGSVSVAGNMLGAVGPGFVILVGVTHDDTPAQATLLAHKIAHLRVFEDRAGKMNLSILDAGGDALVVSQFTLYADCRKGRRPSFTDAAVPDVAVPLIDRFVEALRAEGVPKVETGEFGAMMVVHIENDGPVTIVLDTKDR